MAIIYSRIVAALALASLGVSAQAIVLDQIDTFQDGTVASWAGGAAPTNIATGGPAGVGDRYMQLSATQSNGPGSRLATINLTQWIGNYTTAGVTVVELDMANPNAVPLQMRAVLHGQTGTQWVSTQAVVLPANSGWRRVTFLIREADLTRTIGDESYAAVASNPERFQLRHEVGSAGVNGTAQMGQLRLDNIGARNVATVRPSTLTRVAGRHISGVVSDLFSSDNSYVWGEFDLAADLITPIIFRIDGTSPIANPTKIEMQFESAGDITLRRQVIEMFNWQSLQWEFVAQHFLSTIDGVTTVLITSNPGRFVQPGTGLMRTQLNYDEGASEDLSPLTVRIDQAIWKITPP